MKARRRRRGQAPLPKNVQGYWKIWFRVDVAQPDGTVRRVQRTKVIGPVSAMTYSQAAAEARRVVQPLNDLAPGVEYSDRTLGQLIDLWRSSVKRSKKLSTQMSYEWTFKRLKPLWGVPVGQLDRARVQAFLADAAYGRKPLSPVSVHDLKTHFCGLLSRAVEWGWIPNNPAKGIFRDLPRKVNCREKRILQPAEIAKLVEAIKEPYATMVLLACCSGLRAGELGALRWRDIQPDGVAVSQAVYRGKLDTPKSAKSATVVPIGPRLRQALGSWRERARFVGPDDYVFAVRRNMPVDAHNIANRHLKPAAHSLGLGVVSWHALRHTYCTLGRKSGVAPESMRRLMRHASVLTTLDVYSHNEEIQTDAERIEQLVCYHKVLPAKEQAIA